MKMAGRAEQIARIYRTHFESFIDFAFRQLHPNQKLRKVWHIKLLADRVGTVAKGETKRLIINAPPRSLKSFIGTICLASFVLGRDPAKRIVLIFGHDTLANEMMKRLHDLMQSARYKSIFTRLQCKVAQTTISTQYGGVHPFSGCGAPTRRAWR